MLIKKNDYNFKNFDFANGFSHRIAQIKTYNKIIQDIFKKITFLYFRNLNLKTAHLKGKLNLSCFKKKKKKKLKISKFHFQISTKKVEKKLFSDLLQ